MVLLFSIVNNHRRLREEDQQRLSAHPFYVLQQKEWREALQPQNNRTTHRSRQDKPVQLSFKQQREERTFESLEWGRPHTISLQQASSSQQEDKFKAWWQVVKEQFAGASPEVRRQISELSAEGFQPRKIAKHLSLVEHGFYVATIELILQEVKRELDDERRRQAPLPSLPRSKLPTAIDSKAVNSKAVASDIKPSKRGSVRGGLKALFGKMIPCRKSSLSSEVKEETVAGKLLAAVINEDFQKRKGL